MLGIKQNHKTHPFNSASIFPIFGCQLTPNTILSKLMLSYVELVVWLTVINNNFRPFNQIQPASQSVKVCTEKRSLQCPSFPKTSKHNTGMGLRGFYIIEWSWYIHIQCILFDHFVIIGYKFLLEIWTKHIKYITITIKLVIDIVVVKTWWWIVPCLIDWTCLPVWSSILNDLPCFSFYQRLTMLCLIFWPCL